MSGVATAIVGSAIISGMSSSNAAKTQAQSAAAANAQQQAMFNTQNAQQAPYRTAGYSALNQIGSGMGGEYTKYDASGNPTGTAQGSGEFSHMFNAADLQSQLAPNYQFQLAQGQGQAQNMANTSGGLLSGNTLQGLNQFTQNYAGNAYQTALGNYTGQQTNIYNRLSNLAGLGQTANQSTGILSANTANQIGNNITSAGAAQAAGQVGVGNAISGGLQGFAASQTPAFRQATQGNPTSQSFTGGGGINSSAGDYFALA